MSNDNLMMVRPDPVRMAMVSRLRKEGEKDGDFLRRCIDALAKVNEDGGKHVKTTRN